MPFWRVLSRIALTATIALFSGIALAGTTWDGGGANASWGTANNWNPDGLPLFNGTETITLGTAFTSGTTLTLDGTRNISSLLINTITAFTIAPGTGGSLDLFSGNITRQDVFGTENVQTISANVILGDPAAIAAYTGTWNIAGSNSLNLSGVISETGGVHGITKTGVGTVILSGTNTFSGGVTLNAGIVSISSDANLGASSSSITFNGGALFATDNVVSARAIIMTGAGIFYTTFGKTLEESGAVSGNGNLTTANSGTLILSGSGSNGTGTTTVSGAVLSLRGTVSLGSGVLTLSGGLLELGNGDFTRALGAAAGQVNMNSASGGAGFGAFGADRTVNLGGSGATVTWGAGNFVASAQPLYLGTPTADSMVDFQNPINLNGASRTVTVTDGVGTGVDAKLSGVISGAAASNLVISAVGFAPWNPGSLLLSNGNNSYAGTTTINGGTLLLGANATGTAGNTVLGSGASDVLVGNTSGTLNAGLLTNGAFTISRNIRAQSGNTGTVSIGGNTADPSTFSGSIFLGTASGTGKGVTLTAANGGTTTFSGVIQDPSGVIGPGLVTKTGAGTVVLSGVNTYAGGTAINAGTLSINQSANLGAIGGGLTINAGTLEVTGTFSTIRVITLGDAASTFQIDPSQTYTVTSAIGGSGALNKTGAGTMVLSGANTYSGGTNVSAGTLQLGAVDRLLNTGAITVSGGTLDLQTFAETVGSVTLSGGSITGSGAGTLTGSSYTMESGTVSAILNGTGAMTKSTSGTVTLSGANTFTGAITISDGTLMVAAASGSALGSTSGITVNSGGTLCLGANDQINNGATMTLAGGTFAKGNFAEGTTGGQGIGALTLTAADSHIDFGSGTVGVLSFASLNASTFTLTIDNWTGTYNTIGDATTDRLVFDADQTANLADFIFTGFGTGGVQFALGGGYFEVVAAVPEPSTYLVGMLALGALGWGSRRRFLAVLRN